MNISINTTSNSSSPTNNCEDICSILYEKALFEYLDGAIDKNYDLI